MGKVYSKSELLEISELLHSSWPNVMVLSDEVYEHMAYDGNKHIHFAALPHMFDRTVTLFSAGKTFSTTGWRIGYSISSAQNIHHIKTLHSIINFSTTTTFQKVMAKAFLQAQESGYFPWLAQMLQKKRDKLCASLYKIGGYSNTLTLPMCSMMSLDNIFLYLFSCVRIYVQRILYTSMPHCATDLFIN